MTSSNGMYLVNKNDLMDGEEMNSNCILYQYMTYVVLSHFPCSKHISNSFGNTKGDVLVLVCCT